MRTVQPTREGSDALPDFIFVKVNTRISQRESLEKVKRVIELPIDFGGEIPIEASESIQSHEKRKGS